MSKYLKASLLLIAILIACKSQASWRHVAAEHPTTSCEASLVSNAHNTAFLRVTEDALLKGILTASDLDKTIATLTSGGVTNGTVANPLAHKTHDEKSKPRYDAYKKLIDSHKLDLPSLRPQLQKLIADNHATENKKNEVANTTEVRNIFMPRIATATNIRYRHADYYETSKGPMVIAVSHDFGTQIYFLNDIKNPILIEDAPSSQASYFKTPKGREVLIVVDGNNSLHVVDFNNLPNLNLENLSPSVYHIDRFRAGTDIAGTGILWVESDNHQTETLIDLDTERQFENLHLKSVDFAFDQEGILLQILYSHPTYPTFDALYAKPYRIKLAILWKKLSALNPVQVFIHKTHKNQNGDKIIVRLDEGTAYIRSLRGAQVKVKDISDIHTYFTLNDKRRIALVRPYAKYSVGYFVDIDNPKKQTGFEKIETVNSASAIKTNEAKTFLVVNNHTERLFSVLDVAANNWVLKNLKYAGYHNLIRSADGKQFILADFGNSTVGLVEISSTPNITSFSLPIGKPYFIKFFSTRAGKELIVVRLDYPSRWSFGTYLIDIKTGKVTEIPDVKGETTSADYFYTGGREQLLIRSDHGKNFLTVDLFADPTQLPL